MAKVSGAEMICQILEQEFVEYMFGVFGDIQTDFARAVSHSSIKWVPALNEKSAGFMADMYARVSKKPGVVHTTLGPGSANLCTALANATHDRSPLIAISDQVKSTQNFAESHQYIDFEKAFHPSTGICKDVFYIDTSEKIGSVLKKAFYIACSEPMGAVHISVAANVFSTKITPDRDSFAHVVRLTPSYDASFRTLVTFLKKRKNGIVLAGGGVERGSSEAEFNAFAHHFQLPVLQTFRGMNVMSSEDPLCLGTISRNLEGEIQKILSEFDYLLLIGYEFNEGISPDAWSYAVKTVINITAYDNRIKGVFESDTIVTDYAKFFRFLQQSASKYPKSKTRNLFIRSVKKKLKVARLRSLPGSAASNSPSFVIRAVNQVFSSDSIIICDVGLNKYYSGFLLKAGISNRVFFSNGLSSMGFSSGSLGAYFADDQKNIVVITGDGGFLMDPQEVLTAHSLGRKIVYIIFNNGSLGLVKKKQVKSNGASFGVELPNVSFEKIAKAFNIEGFTVEKASDCLSYLKKAYKMKESCLLDIKVKYE